ncbi:MAG: hypothetical protein E6J68_09750, partial [Deltaproteobacteria bacterium]
MAERAAHLVDHVLPADVPVRQWVLSVPHRLRYRPAYDHRLCRTVLHVFVRALRSAYRRQARRQGLPSGETGMVTSVQRFGGAVNVHLHYHTLVLDGVFVRESDGALRFHPASPPTDDDVRRVVARVRRRLERLGLSRATFTDEDTDPLADESAALASLSRAALLGRTALGDRAGRGPARIGADPDAPWVERPVPLHAQDGGFDLHAAVHVAAGDRERLERSASTSAVRRSGRAACTGCATGGSPSRCSAHGRTGRPMSSSPRRSSSSGSCRSCRGRGSTWCSITASWHRTRHGAGGGGTRGARGEYGRTVSSLDACSRTARGGEALPRAPEVSRLGRPHAPGVRSGCPLMSAL